MCMALAKAARRPGNEWRHYSDALFDALEDGTHKHAEPHVSLVKRGRPPSDDVRHFLRCGTGIGVTQRPENRAERGFGELTY